MAITAKASVIDSPARNRIEFLIGNLHLQRDVEDGKLGLLVSSDAQSGIMVSAHNKVIFEVARDRSTAAVYLPSVCGSAINPDRTFGHFAVTKKSLST
jgi:hypothetical protein